MRGLYTGVSITITYLDANYLGIILALYHCIFFLNLDSNEYHFRGSLLKTLVCLILWRKRSKAPSSPLSVMLCFCLCHMRSAEHCTYFWIWCPKPSSSMSLLYTNSSHQCMFWHFVLFWIFCTTVIVGWLCWEKKGRDLTLSCDKSPYTHRKVQKATWQHIKLPKTLIMRTNVALAIFQPCRDLEAGENQFLKSKRRDRESNPVPLALQVKSLTTTQALLSYYSYTLNPWYIKVWSIICVHVSILCKEKDKQMKVVIAYFIYHMTYPWSS